MLGFLRLIRRAHRRNFVRPVALLLLGLAVLLCTSRLPSSPTIVDTAAVVVGQGCTPTPAQDAEAAATLIASVQCVAGRGVKTRGHLKPSCLLDPKALQEGAVYYAGECKGVTTTQGEAVAQARAIAQLNRDGVYGDHAPPGDITPNLQWETVMRQKPNSSVDGRVDLVIYDRSKTNSDLGLVEIKGDWNGGEDAGAEQVNDYVSGNADEFGGHVPTAYSFTSSFLDTFVIDRCAKKTDPYIDEYTTKSVLTPGVLVVHRERSDCNGKQKTQAEIRQEETAGVKATMGQDEDNNGNDDALDAVEAWAQDNMADVDLSNVKHAYVQFPHPLEIHLTAHQIEDFVIHVLEVAVTGGAPVKVLKGMASASSGDTAGAVQAAGSEMGDAAVAMMNPANNLAQASIDNSRVPARAGHPRPHRWMPLSRTSLKSSPRSEAEPKCRRSCSRRSTRSETASSAASSLRTSSRR